MQLTAKKGAGLAIHYILAGFKITLLAIICLNYEALSQKCAAQRLVISIFDSGIYDKQTSTPISIIIWMKGNN